ncbi:MAG: sulfotransferase, partial [Alphaproteobacteria bacterium]
RDFERSQALEAVLAEVNGAIGPVLPPPYTRPRFPVVFILGNARSGTTLMLQWLSQLGAFSYPSNMLARFFANPYFGARVQQALADYDKEDLIGLRGGWDFKSDLGRTRGALAPSEFWYFWRRFFKFGEIQCLSDAELAAVDADGFRRGLAGIEAAFDKPLALKAMIMNWHAPYLDSILDHALFLHVRRDRFACAQSIYEARQRFYGDADRWYAFKPREYPALADKDPFAQVAGQVHYTDRAIEQGLAGVVEDRKLVVDYEAFCADPAATYGAIARRFAAQGCNRLPARYEGPAAFDVNKTVRLDAADADRLRAALATYADG